MGRIIPVSQRLEPRINICELTECWLWAGQQNRNGYGRIKVQGRWLMVHRLVYELHIGPIGEGLVLDHLCRNRLCCNPKHLEPVTSRENTLRGEAKLFRKGVTYEHSDQTKISS